jgi:adenylylsulfate kinase
VDDGSGRVIWITGLSGAGKTTLAKALLPRFRRKPVFLDGDEMRAALEPVAAGYSSEERKKLAFTYARLCRLVASQGNTVVCATISLFHEVRRWNRAHLPGYFEIYMKADDAVLRDRDYKGVYRKAGQAAANIVGHDVAPEFPESPDLVLEQNGLGVEDMMEAVRDSAIGDLFGGERKPDTG